MMKKIIISMVAIMIMFTVSACDDDMPKADPVPPTDQVVTEEIVTEPEVFTGAEVTDIGEAEAKAIVLAKVPGATENDIYEFDREYDNGRIEYEGSMYYNGYEYEFDVDGTNGNILQWEIDRE